MTTRSPGAHAESGHRARAARGTAPPRTQGAHALCAPSQLPHPYSCVGGLKLHHSVRGGAPTRRYGR
eukprot:8646863-Alexandrium_andersonii.AAC.1